MNTELELLKRIDERNYLTEREHREFYGIVEKALINAQDIKEENTRYKNLEEQLGCPLAVLFKALKNGVYSSFTEKVDEGKYNSVILKSNSQSLNRDLTGLVCFYGDDNDERVHMFSDYKKTWWLREDKSE